MDLIKGYSKIYCVINGSFLTHFFQHSPEEISAALCSHYKISSVEELGQGQLAVVMKQSKKRYNQAVNSKPITYEAALCTGIR